MRDPIREMARRPQRYWYSDGLTELAGGIVMLLLGISYLPNLYLPSAITSQWYVYVGRDIVLLLAVFVAKYVVVQVKKRLTYPRSGYVSYRGKSLSQWMETALMAGIALTIGLVFALVSFFAHNVDWLPLAAGTSLAVTLMLTAQRFRLARFYLLAIYISILGGVFSWMGLANPDQTMALFSLFSLGWLVSGTYALVDYLHHTKPVIE